MMEKYLTNLRDIVQTGIRTVVLPAVLACSTVPINYTPPKMDPVVSAAEKKQNRRVAMYHTTLKMSEVLKEDCSWSADISDSLIARCWDKVCVDWKSKSVCEWVERDCSGMTQEEERNCRGRVRVCETETYCTEYGPQERWILNLPEVDSVFNVTGILDSYILFSDLAHSLAVNVRMEDGTVRNLGFGYHRSAERAQQFANMLNSYVQLRKAEETERNAELRKEEAEKNTKLKTQLAEKKSELDIIKEQYSSLPPEMQELIARYGEFKKKHTPFNDGGLELDSLKATMDLYHLIQSSQGSSDLSYNPNEKSLSFCGNSLGDFVSYKPPLGYSLPKIDAGKELMSLSLVNEETGESCEISLAFPDHDTSQKGRESLERLIFLQAMKEKIPTFDEVTSSFEKAITETKTKISKK